MLTDNQAVTSKGIDPYLIIIYVALVIVGWLTIYSSSYDPQAEFTLFNLDQNYGRQLIWIIISAVFAISILIVDGKFFYNNAYIIYIIFMLLILSVLVIGTDINGAKAWIKIGAFSIQPIEFAKFATALALARFFNEGKTDNQRRHIFLLAFAFILVPAAIAILQKDTGSALVFFAFIIMFYREGFNSWLMLMGVLIVLTFVLTLMWNELYTIAFLLVVLCISCFFGRSDTHQIIYAFLHF